MAHRISVNAWSTAKNGLFAHYRADRDRDYPELSPDLLALVSALWQIPAQIQALEKQRLAVLGESGQTPA